METFLIAVVLGVALALGAATRHADPVTDGYVQSAEVGAEAEPSTEARRPIPACSPTGSPISQRDLSAPDVWWGNDRDR